MRWHHFRDRPLVDPPERFTNPFHYTPHPLCLAAADEVLAYLAESHYSEKESGKMFGVLIVRNSAGELGFLAAFSGNLAGLNDEPYFVPPICDLTQPSVGYKSEEARVSAINHQLEKLEHDPTYHSLLSHFDLEKRAWTERLQQAKEQAKRDKAIRDQLRQSPLTPEESSQLIRESQYQKAELKRLARRAEEALAPLQEKIQEAQSIIEQLKAERKRRSQALQQALFDQYLLRNARGDHKSVREIFERAERGIPPGGTGECAAPKLLQYAYAHDLTPLAMAEFWWGEPLMGEGTWRRPGCFYPACREKCEPLLHFMLQGLEVDPDPLAQPYLINPKIIWEDDAIVIVDKPAGVLSVPGKNGLDSILDWARRRYPEATGPLLVHRLDMATSGLLLVAKRKEIHERLQAQFERREVKKRYVALLEHAIQPTQGTISLPLCPDPTDRPRQIAHSVYGKPALTYYKVVGLSGPYVRVHFSPQTGRTHQLRVHAAHPQGLNSPIVGDSLYGHAADRLYLHAYYLSFRHPLTDQWLEFESAPDF